MARITVEDCLNRENNRFALILLAARRTKQILNGAKPLLEVVKNKAVVNSQREIAAGQVRFMTEEDRARVEEKERQAKEEALAKAAQVAAEERESIFISSVDEAQLFDNSDNSDSDEDETGESPETEEKNPEFVEENQENQQQDNDQIEEF